MNNFTFTKITPTKAEFTGNNYLVNRELDISDIILNNNTIKKFYLSDIVLNDNIKSLEKFTDLIKETTSTWTGIIDANKPITEYTAQLLKNSNIVDPIVLVNHTANNVDKIFEIFAKYNLRVGLQLNSSIDTNSFIFFLKKLQKYYVNDVISFIVISSPNKDANYREHVFDYILKQHAISLLMPNSYNMPLDSIINTLKRSITDYEQN